MPPVFDAVFRDRRFNGDAKAFAQSLLIELRPMLSGDQVKAAAKGRKHQIKCGWRVWTHHRALQIIDFAALSIPN
jgi:hypothetical protein